MNEEEARAAVESLVGAVATAMLERLVDMIVDENDRQNLIARSTVAEVWNRHVLDSVQLIRWAPAEGDWIDIGTGGGFPGLAIAAVTQRPMLLVEPRRRRADFLKDAAARCGWRHVTVDQRKIEAISHPAAVISARAVTTIEKLLQSSRQCATPPTRWLLPRGLIDGEELAALRTESDMMFHVEQSVSDPRSSIVIAERRPR